MKKQSGFTLIELVIVVVILGFLAVTAIPKFLDLTDQAKQANIEGMAGGFATAVSLTRAQWEAEGRPQDTNTNFVNYDGSALYLTTPATNTNAFRPGYPMGLTTTGANNGNMNTTRCIEVWNNILAQPPSISDTAADLNNGANIDYFVVQSVGTGSNGNNTCIFYLKESLPKSGGSYATPTSTAQGNNFTYDPASSTVAITINN
ncbi:prepilin-type N-terminal cleavage/methylation domain-containing protein [Colwellia sp. 1_MG-2023]|uniref:type II secretion system protein n=1 Tax=Colwellia sp. 1_MG-2023 TaxID=3062649 RepID=UPI0026E1DBF6|nr:prepilin-type N-terminal cleavage/methylation domain-containing protein [Colwellia sp. 1_MG-2023]MDO6444737.1 prepilin-type N-terminal cleavage/methylation domain-containing protein [Colwellia sp. 1_MG-2023]